MRPRDNDGSNRTAAGKFRRGCKIHYQRERSNAKIVIPSGTELVNIIGEMAGVLPIDFKKETRKERISKSESELLFIGKCRPSVGGDTAPRRFEGRVESVTTYSSKSLKHDIEQQFL